MKLSDRFKIGDRVKIRSSGDSAEVVGINSDLETVQVLVNGKDDPKWYFYTSVIHEREDIRDMTNNNKIFKPGDLVVLEEDELNSNVLEVIFLLPNDYVECRMYNFTVIQLKASQLVHIRSDYSVNTRTKTVASTDMTGLDPIDLKQIHLKVKWTGHDLEITMIKKCQSTEENKVITGIFRGTDSVLTLKKMTNLITIAADCPD